MTRWLPVLHWYNLVCPLSYVAQGRNALLVRHGFEVVELAFHTPPKVPIRDPSAGARTGPTYAAIEREAAAAGLPVAWPHRRPDPRRALAAAEWVRRTDPRSFVAFRAALFAAHFAHREDLGDRAVVERHARIVGVDVDALREALAGGRAQAMLAAAEAAGRWHGVRDAPAWFMADRLVSGLIPVDELERLTGNGTTPSGAAH